VLQKRYRVILGVLLLAVYCFAFQGARNLFDPDEGRYSAVALQMIKSHDWLVPRTHPDHEHWAKPPLAYWAIAGSILAFGKNEFAVRFPNALAFLVTIILSFCLGKVFVPKRPWTVSLMFATFLFPATVCNGATTDYLLTMWETMAMCFFARAFWGKNENKQFTFILFMWASFGLAFLTKGPPSLLPLFSIMAFLPFKGAKRQNFSMYWMRGFLIFLFIASSWFVIVILKDSALTRYFLWDETILRVFTSHHARHSSWYAALYIFLPVLVLGTFPWCYYAGKGAIQAAQTAKKSAGSVYDEENSKSLFLTLWFIIPLAVFVIAKSKLPLYVLPLFVPVAIVTAREIERLNVSLYKFRYGIAVWCVFIVLVRLIMASISFKQDSSRFADEIKRQYPHSVEEIIFVDTVPAFGLQFYTGSDMKQVSFEFSDLERELVENKSRLWLVVQNEAEQFREAMTRHPVRMQELGAIAARENYVLFREIDDKIQR
jgi:4-amino-4-deoxy-L-arabinose transferase-like glycosyltransferase